MATPTDLLHAIASTVEAAVHTDPDGTIVYIVRNGEELELGLRPLDGALHPCVELRGFVAPAGWWAMGLVTHGTATFLEEGRKERIVSTFFASRDGDEVSLLRRPVGVEVLPAPAEGRVPELLRQALRSRG